MGEMSLLAAKMGENALMTQVTGDYSALFAPVQSQGGADPAAFRHQGASFPREIIGKPVINNLAFLAVHLL